MSADGIELTDQKLPWKDYHYKNDRLAVLVWLLVRAILSEGRHHSFEFVVSEITSRLTPTHVERDRLARLVRYVIWAAIRNDALLRDGKYDRDGEDIEDTRTIWLPDEEAD